MSGNKRPYDIDSGITLEVGHKEILDFQTTPTRRKIPLLKRGQKHKDAKVFRARNKPPLFPFAGDPDPAAHAVRHDGHKPDDGERRRGRPHGQHDHDALLPAPHRQDGLLPGQVQGLLQGPGHLEQSQQPSALRREQRPLPRPRGHQAQAAAVLRRRGDDTHGHRLDGHHLRRRVGQEGHRRRDQRDHHHSSEFGLMIYTS